MNLLNVILSVCITSIMSYFSILNISNQKKNKSDFIIYNLIFILLFTFSCLYLEGLTKLVFSIISIIVSLYLSLFKKDISNSVYYAFAYEILASISEILISLFILLIFKLDGSGYSNIPYSLLISSVLNNILVILFSKIRFISKNIKKINLSIKKNNKDWIYIILIMILMVLFITFNKYNMQSSLEYYISIVFVVFVVVSFVYVIYNKFQKQAIEEKYNESMEYVLRYEKIINEQGKKNHEYNNQLMVIKGYIINQKDYQNI